LFGMRVLPKYLPPKRIYPDSDETGKTGLGP
jgi:hypothetical protein